MNFARILWFMVRKRGLRAAWKRFRLGIYGFTHPLCRQCRGWKGRNSTGDCHDCLMAPLVAEMRKLFALNN